MDTQNIPIHVRLWNKRFWALALANLLLVMSSYMLIPVIPLRMMNDSSSWWQITAVLCSFFLGMYLLGGCSAYWVQQYRRKSVFVVSTLLLLAVTMSIYYLYKMQDGLTNYLLLILLRFIQGIFYGLSQMVLLGTLIIDTVEAVHRTEANHAATWFGRFSISLGPLLGLVVYHHFDFNTVLLLSCVCVILSLLLVELVRFPFRLPNEDLNHLSLDRFLLKGSHWLFLNIVLVTSILGALLSIEHNPLFYSLIMLGFLVALLAERFAFADADLRSEAVTGLLVIGMSVLLMLTRRQASVGYISPILIGLGYGVLGSRFLLFFIKLSAHCQRGTSQNTFLLAWETGVGIGLAVSFGLFHGEHSYILWFCLFALCVSLIFYIGFVHSWYIKHKNR